MGYTEDGDQDSGSELFKLLAKATFCDPRYKLDYLETAVAEVLQKEIMDEVKTLAPSNYAITTT